MRPPRKDLPTANRDGPIASQRIVGESRIEQDRVKEVGSRHVNENKETEKTTKRDGEGQKSNTGATPNRESNNVEVSEKRERKKE